MGGISLYKRKKVHKLCNPKAPRSLEISTRNLREVIGLGPTRVRKYVVLTGIDQGQVGGQHVPLLGHGEGIEARNFVGRAYNERVSP